MNLDHSMLCVCILFFSAFLAAVSQILLKMSSQEKHLNFLFNYLNRKVFLAYFLFSLTLLLNIYAFTGVAYKYGAVINASSYTFALIFSVVFIGDRFTWRGIFGNVLIVIGIVLYTCHLI